jgi:hypothetical protein
MKEKRILFGCGHVTDDSNPAEVFGELAERYNCAACHNETGRLKPIPAEGAHPATPTLRPLISPAVERDEAKAVRLLAEWAGLFRGWGRIAEGEDSSEAYKKQFEARLALERHLLEMSLGSALRLRQMAGKAGDE